MPLRNLKIFLAVAETGSMSKTAKALYMTQPSISQDISEMERTYKAVLFERKNHRLKLTPTGEMLMLYARKTLDAAHETKNFLNYESAQGRLQQLPRVAKKNNIKDSLHICEITGTDMSCNYQLVYPKNKIFPAWLIKFIGIFEEMGLYDIL
ncbi:MAG: LysR family transcriptional regulator [Oscillospiraceae bacterium]|nr:LysR family transcriptional regulator [Oscillospiraceae bacterium]